MCHLVLRPDRPSAPGVARLRAGARLLVESGSISSWWLLVCVIINGRLQQALRFLPLVDIEEGHSHDLFLLVPDYDVVIG